jgi:hypothetical protein
VGAEPGRRALLAAAAGLPLLAAAGCRGVGALATPPGPGLGVVSLHAAIASEQRLLARYQQVSGHLRHSLAATLDPLAAEHRAHLAQLRRRLVIPSDGPPASPVTSSSPPPVPGTAAGVLAGLRAAEQQAADDLLRRLGPTPPGLAQLLASIAAAEATHAAVLARAHSGQAPG